MYPGFSHGPQAQPELVPIETIPAGGKFKIPKECENFAKGAGPPPSTRMKMEGDIKGSDGKPRNSIFVDGERAGKAEQIPPEIKVYRT